MKTVKRRRSLAGGGYAPYELSETVAVLTQAVESNERQIHEVAQTSAQSIKDLSVIIEKQGGQVNSRLESLAENFQSSQRPNYMLWVAALAIFFTLISAGWKITDLQTQVTMAPIAARAMSSELAINELRKDIATNRDAIHDQSTNNEVIKTKLAEVETQFKSADQTRNVQFAEQQRMNNLILQIAQHKPIIDYPVYPYFFPSIANPHQSAAARPNNE